MLADIRFRVLGPLEVIGPDGRVAISPGRQEVVLAALLLESNRVVQTDHLVDLLWPENPPDTARTQVQILVSRTRKTLAADEMGAKIVTRPPGYVIQIDESELDLLIFRRRLAEARVLAKEGRPADAADLLRSAAGLWRGSCLSGVPSAGLARKGLQLDEERLTATETFLQLELELGRHHQLVAEIGRLVEENPLRDRLRGQLMLALYRSGRQADALDTYRLGRDLMRDRLGLDPGQELRQLETAILAEDPSLLLEPSRPDVPPIVRPDLEPAPRRPRAAHLPAGAGAPAPAASESVPHQLPTDIADVVTDESLVAGAEAVLAGSASGRAVGIVVVVGRPGIGKSTLATHIAHNLSDRHFPDGQLYCDLRGARPDPLAAREVLGRFLRALGIPGTVIPDTLDERAEMYRSLLATRRILVVLDDAVGEAQVGPLLPGSSSCAVLITSRNRLTGLPGAHRVELEVFDRGRALKLLGNIIGHDRVAQEEAAATALTRTVGGLPLALRIVGARLAARPHWTLASMVQRLADERRRLDELAHGELTMRASLSLTYDGLASTDRRLLALLSTAQGSTMPGWLAGALLDDPSPYASDLLEPLVDVQMLDVVGVEATGELRYRFHEIIRLFARERLADTDPGERRAAAGRMLGGWLALAGHAIRSVWGDDYFAGDAVRWEPPTDYTRQILADPVGWLEGERENLGFAVEQAAEEGFDEVSWELACSLAVFFEARGHFDLWERTNDKALAVVRRTGNVLGHAALLRSLGALQIDRRQLAEAQTALSESVELFERLANVRGMAACRRDLGYLARMRGADDEALALYSQAMIDFEQVDEPVGRATVLSQSADIRLRRGDVARAQAQLEEALDIYRSAGHRRGEARTLARLGMVHLRRAEPERAKRVLGDALEMVRGSGDVIGEGHVLHDLGRVSAGTGAPDEAETYFQEALAVRESILDVGGVAAVQVDVAELRHRQGRDAEAEMLLRAAIAVLRKKNMLRDLAQAESLMGLVAGRPA